jgi:hypothetical protein
MVKPKYLRSHEQLIEDCLSPVGFSPTPGTECRNEAVHEVLRRIPKKDYRTLTKMIDDFLWFIPPDSVRGKIHPFPCTTEEEGLVPHAKVLYLSPSLEKGAFDITVAIVAHELAHLVLGHNMYPKAQEAVAQEDAAWELIRKWGFEREEKKNSARWKRFDTRMKRLIEQARRKS